MIFVSRDEVLLRFDGIPTVLKILHKLHLAITCKKFHPGKTSSLLYCRDPAFPDEIFPCNCFSLPKLDEIVN